jgi:integrase/recombinase XerD
MTKQQFSTKTMTVKFYLKAVKSSKIGYKVHVQITYNRTKAELTTGIACSKIDWNAQKEEFRQNSLYNQQLADMKTKIYRAKNLLDDLGQDFDARDIKCELTGVKKVAETFSDFFDDFMGRKLGEGNWSESTKKLYFKTQDYTQDFLTNIHKPNLKLRDVTLSRIADFDDYLRQLIWNENGDKLGTTTINKHHSRLKAVINDAITRGKMTLNPYRNFKLSFPESNREYLTKEEIEAIQTIDTLNDGILDNIRNIFLFSCYTGLRFGDAMNLNVKDIKTVSKKRYIRVDQAKTDKRREIPLLKAANAIIDKYETHPFRKLTGRVLPKLANQTVNRYLKMIASMAGIEKNLSHHIARHTCATTILLDNNVPIEVASHWLGHTSIKTTQIYAKISHAKLVGISNQLDDIL